MVVSISKQSEETTLVKNCKQLEANAKKLDKVTSTVTILIIVILRYSMFKGTCNLRQVNINGLPTMAHTSNETPANAFEADGKVRMCALDN